MATAFRCQSLGYPTMRFVCRSRDLQPTTTTTTTNAVAAAAGVYIRTFSTAGQPRLQRSFGLNLHSSPSTVSSDLSVRTRGQIQTRHNTTAAATRVKALAASPYKTSINTVLTFIRRSSSTSSTSPPQHPSTMAQKSTSLTSAPLIDLLENRRSYYTLNSSLSIPDSKVQELVTKALLTVPSAFNMQSTRIVLTVGPDHEFVWDTTAKVLREHMGEERWAKAPTGKKLDGFRAAHGTVLFYDDVADVDKMKEQFAAYKDKFSAWADHSQGMHQLAVWTALAAENIGCNLQHYNPVIDKTLAEKFGVPDSWELKAQLVFGGIVGDRPAPKDKKPIETTLKVFGV